MNIIWKGRRPLRYRFSPRRFAKHLRTLPDTVAFYTAARMVRTNASRQRMFRNREFVRWMVDVIGPHLGEWRAKKVRGVAPGPAREGLRVVMVKGRSRVIQTWNGKDITGPQE